MQNNYTVIHSQDPWLLARLSTDLMMEGIKDDRGWNEKYAMYDDWLWIKILPEGMFEFHCHECDGIKFRLTLTASNYLQTLKTIIERHGGGGR